MIDSQPLIVALLARWLFAESINPIGWIGLVVAGIVCLGVPAPLLQRWWLQADLSGADGMAPRYRLDAAGSAGHGLRHRAQPFRLQAQ